MKTLEEIQQALDETVNRLIAQHGGRVQIVRIDELDVLRVAYTSMSGGCRGCAGAKATMKSIVTNCIMDFDSSITGVQDITDHTDKTNAFFKE